MGYVTEFEICSLVFLIVVAVRFFCMHRFHNRPNRIFGILLNCSMVILTLDIIGSYLVMYADFVPLWLNYVVNWVFYFLQIGISGVLLLYVLVLSGRDISKTAIWLFVPLLVSELILLSNPFTKAIFYFIPTSDGIVFAHGKLFTAFYIMGGFNLFLSFCTTLKLRRSFRKIEVRSILSFILIITSAMVLQFLFPWILLTGTAMSIAIFLMFLTLQNPETMLDAITGTFNYTALIDYLRKQISDDRAMWISAIDIGGIRRINSAMGIGIGNEILEKVGAYLNDACKNHATVFRMIGTRFVIISDSARVHNHLIVDITERFQKPWMCEETSAMILATVRYCEQKNKFSVPEDVINLIDLAYSHAVEEGFGTTRPVDVGRLKEFHRRSQIKDALTRALSSGKGFYLNYQPIYSVKDKCFCGAEVLLRLNDPILGPISPAEFIPVAESTNMIPQIDGLVIQHASQFLKDHPELRDNGLKLLQINLSAAEFNNDTEKMYTDILESIDSLEDMICFEVTETAVTHRREVLSDFMNRLIEKGVRFAIDDFGTGYANITQLAKLPFSVVKLDRIFVSQNSEKEANILRDLVNMFDHIGLMTVFEGVETEQQANFASDIGVGQIQGYFYSYPLAEDDFVHVMTASN